MRQRFVPALLSLSLGIGGGVLGAGAVMWSKAEAKAPAFAASQTPQVQARAVSAQGEVIADLVEKVGPAVVNIDTVSRRTVVQQPMHPFFGFDPFFGDPRASRPQTRTYEQKGVGSGFIIDSKGLVVTNDHVVSKANELTVTLPDGRKFKGKVIGRDAASDLALVKIDGKDLPSLKLAHPDSIRVGQWVVAIGSPLGLKYSVTAGILSAVNRDGIKNRVGFLQTDAPINPGNSGGPLMNLQGEVIGVNTAIIQHAQGIGFAVPVDTVSRVVPQLEAKGRVERAWIGVGLADLPDDRSRMFYPAEYGALIGRVEPKSPADKAGLVEGDVILALDGQKIEDSSSLMRAVSAMNIGEKAKLTVNRRGQTKELTLTLGKMPEQLQQASEQAEESEDR
ncbi:putative serine protease HtrA [compost metagenome]